MIEISFLPHYVMRSRMKAFPISNDFAHGFVGRERQHRVHMVRHQQEKCDMPSHGPFIELS